MAELGLYALPFGFGPASKAVAVAQAINERSTRPVRWTFVSSGIGLELMRRSGLAGTWCDTGQLDADEALADRFGRELDAMIIVMHRQWSHLMAPRLPVFCVDSLAHMWRPGAFDAFPGMQKVTRYYVQDLFGAEEAMRGTPIPHVVPVRPIMAKGSGRPQPWQGRPIFHLGGLLTPFTDERADAYVAGVVGLARRVAPDAVILTSAQAAQRFAPLLDGVAHASTDPADAIETFTSASVVYSSPGLTGLIEMCATRVPMIPLPPANYSQVLTLRRLTSAFGAQLGDVWSYLDAAYASVADDLPEPEGVRQVTQLNTRLLGAPEFHQGYVAAVDRVRGHDLTLPRQFCGPPVGADDIAHDLLTCLHA